MIASDSNRLPFDRKVLTRFFSKIKINPDVAYKGVPCWLWTPNLDRDGYARFWYVNQSRSGHNIAYQMFVERLPPNLVPDHLCRVRHCVNPVHIEAVTNRVNTLRGTTITAALAAQTHCKRGHEFTDDNTKMYNGSRWCKACCRLRSRQQYWKNPEHYRALDRAYRLRAKQKKISSHTL